MDNSSDQREQVYCHQCEDEWYRDEHGLVCPQCESEFTEVIEAYNDPRNEMVGDAAHHPHHGAPDPDEDDISDIRWEYTDVGPQHSQQHATGNAGPTASSAFTRLGSILGVMTGGTQFSAGQSHDSRQTRSGMSTGSRTGARDQGTRPGTFVSHGDDAGFSWSITAHTGVMPENPHGQEPRMAHSTLNSVRDIGEFMQAVMNGMQNAQDHRNNNPSGAPQGLNAFAAIPISPILATMLGSNGGMQNGDAVHSQEALDRVISRLMEQHTSDNAPGPAPREAIESLPKRAITAFDLGSENKAECSICMDGVKLAEEVTELPCHHWFHDECIKAWLSERDTCPHCRQGIMPKEESTASPGRVRNYDEAPRHDQRGQQQQQAMAGNGAEGGTGVVPDAAQGPRPSDMSGLSTARGDHDVSSSGSRSSRNSGGSNSEGLLSRMRAAFGGGDNNEGC